MIARTQEKKEQLGPIEYQVQKSRRLLKDRIIGSRVGGESCVFRAYVPSLLNAAAKENKVRCHAELIRPISIYL